MAELEKLEIKVTVDSEDAVKGLEKLKSTMKTVMGSLGDAVKNVGNVSKKFDNLTSSISKVPKTVNIDIDASSANTAKTAVGDVLNTLNNMPNSVDVSIEASGAETVESVKASVDDLVNSTTPLELLELKIEGLKGKLSEALEGDSATPDTIANLIQKIQQLSIYLDAMSDKPTELADNLINSANNADLLKMKLEGVRVKLAEALANPKANHDAIAKLTQQAQKLKSELNKTSSSSKSLSSKLKGLMKDIRKTGSEFNKSSKSGMSFANVLKSVMVYGGMYRLFYMFTTGISDGLKNVAQYSDETADNMNRLSTIAHTLKNSIGASLYPAIVALTPALTKMAEAVAKALEFVSKIFSVLAGKTTYLKAKEQFKEYVDTAKKSANEIKKSFAGMDEITVIGQKDSGSEDGEDYGSMFEEVPIENLGQMKKLAETLKKIAIVVLGIVAAVKIIGTIANVVEGLIGLYPFFGILIAAIGIVLQLFSAVDAWVNGTTWENLAGQLAGIGIAIAGMAIQFGPIGAAISSIVGGIILVVTSVKDWLENGTSWENFLGVMAGLAAIFGGISLLCGSWIPMAIGAVVATIVAIIMWWDEISAFFVNLWNTILGFFAGIWDAVVEFFSGIANWVWENILAPIVEFFTPFVEAIVGFFGAIWSVVVSVFSAIWSVISTIFMAIYEVVAYVIGLIIDFFVGLGQAVWAVISKIYEIIATVVQMIWAVISWLFGVIWEFICSIASWVWDKVIQPIITFVSNLVTSIVNIFTSIVNVIKTKVIDPIVNFFKNLINTIVGFFKGVGTKVADTISGAFRSVMNGVFTIVENVVNFFIKAINGAIGIINKIPGVEIKKIELLSIPRFATGGFPEDGLFMANHGELVGKFSNGKTAVANNEQIVEGITGGVYAANQEQNGLLREQNKLLRQLVEKQSNGQIDVTTITTAMQRKNRRDGKTVVPVGV